MSCAEAGRSTEAPATARHARRRVEAAGGRYRLLPQTGHALRLEAGQFFMNVEIGSTGEVAVRPPRSRPGDHILLRAEMPLVVGLTACSAEMSNNYSFKPIDVEIYG